MRLIIYGAGGIGCVVGGHLARTGHDVVLIGRPGHVKAINEHGLRLITPDGTHTLRIPAVTEPVQIDFKADDVVLLCMKSQDTEEANRNLKAVTEDVPVFCLQNSVRNEETVARYFSRVYGVMVRVGAVYLTDGEVMARRDPPGWLIIGRYPDGTDELAEVVGAKLHAAGFFVKITPDVMPYKWGKLMLNLGNAPGAITNVPIGFMGDNDPITRTARQEFRDVLAKAGVRWVSPEELAQEWPEINSAPHGTIKIEAQSSTWQSLARKQGTVEVDFLNGEVVRLAEKLGIKAPVNETLVNITHEMAAKGETPGKYTPDQLGELLGLKPD